MNAMLTICRVPVVVSAPDPNQPARADHFQYHVHAGKQGLLW